MKEGDTIYICVFRESIPEMVTVEQGSKRGIKVSLGREVGLDIQGTESTLSNQEGSF